MHAINTVINHEVVHGQKQFTLSVGTWNFCVRMVNRQMVNGPYVHAWIIAFL